MMAAEASLQFTAALCWHWQVDSAVAPSSSPTYHTRVTLPSTLHTAQVWALPLMFWTRPFWSQV